MATGEDQVVIDRAWELYRQRRPWHRPLGWFDDGLWTACMAQAKYESEIRQLERALRHG